MSIDAMKLALEALEFCAGTSYATDANEVASEAVTALRQAIEQVEQAQPVACRYDFDGYGYQYIDNGSGSSWQTRHKDAEPLYTSPPKAHNFCPRCGKRTPNADDVHTCTPPKREWVGLTSADWNDFNAVKGNDPNYVASWAEAKLKEKNT